MDMETQGIINVGNDYGIEVELDTLVVKGDATKLFQELALAQAEFKPVPKASTGQVGMQKFQYASYATLIRCVRPALSAHGIALFQPLHSRGNMAVTTTILAGHGASVTSSFSFKSEFTKKQKDNTVIDDPQEFGRHHTYYRRYQLQAMLGIEGDKDADELPDVNEEKAQYVEAAKEPKQAPKAAASVEVKSAPVAAPKTNGSAMSSSSSPLNGEKHVEKPAEKPVEKAPEKPAEKPAEKVPAPVATKAIPNETTRTINELLQSGIEQLQWKMADVKEFYKEHVDEAGFETAAKLTIDQKQALFGKMVTLKQVIPF